MFTFELISFALGGVAGAILTVSSSVIYNFVKAKVAKVEAAVPGATGVVNAAVNTVVTDATNAASVEALVTAAASHLSNLKTTLASLAAAATKL